jgi:hypothetical protein
MGLGAALAGPAAARPVADHAVLNGRTGRVAVAINSMTPRYAGPGATVTLTGSVSNGTSQTQAGLQVQLYTSPEHFTSRDGMESFQNQGTDTVLVPAGSPFVIAASLKPGASADWRASFSVNAEGISDFGVYPVAAQLADTITGDVLTSAQTLLPFWPGQRAAGLARPVNISWLWPLIDQPHHTACTAITNSDLTASLSPGGRLSALLTAGMSHADADLTWVMDPALLSDAATMSGYYYVNPKPDCVGTGQPPSKAAASWLADLKTATSGQPAVLTPYANVDMTALVHQGLTPELASAYAQGETVARSVLGGTFAPKIAWPAGGNADLSVLTNLSTADGIGTVVLSSSEMPPADAGTFEPDDAVTSVKTAAGTTMNVLLADSTLTGVLADGDTSSGALPASTGFAVEQRFLAETAMIAAEAPDSERSLVVAPPQNWSPSQGLASDLLGETVSAPWLKPATAASLTTAPDSERTMARKPPPASEPSHGELSRSYLQQVALAGVQLAKFKSVLDLPSAGYLQSLNQALAATASSAWRGTGSAAGQALTSSLSGYLTYAEGKIKIVGSKAVPMGGASGSVPVAIQNEGYHAVKVRLTTSVDNTDHPLSQLTIGRFKDVVVVRPNQAVTVTLPVRSAPQGSTQITLSLTTQSGQPLLSRPFILTVQSTRDGRAILFLIGAAIGVFVLSSLYRGVRRRLRDDAQVVHTDADLPGSVVTGTSARQRTEAPDDLADARRWADDA